MLEEVLSIVRDQSRTAENIFGIVQQMQWKEIETQNALYPNLANLNYLATFGGPSLGGPLKNPTGLVYGGLEPETPAPRLRMSNGRLYVPRSGLDAFEEEPEIDEAGPGSGEDV